MHSILFVCLGNICRSPMAEGAMRRAAQESLPGLVVDSAGTAGWHEGELPDPRAIIVASSHGVDISMQRARQIVRDDFDRFDLIVAMDPQNLADLRARAPDNVRASMILALDLVQGRNGEGVTDPYYGGDAEFLRAWQDVDTVARALVRSRAAS